MTIFERNLNIFGIDEPLLFPIKRADQPEIHLARLLYNFFEFNEGKCILSEVKGEILITWSRNGVPEKWTISENRGNSTPNAARKEHPYLTIKDVQLVKSLKDFISNYPNREIDLGKIIGIGGEGTVLEQLLERLNYSFLLDNIKFYSKKAYLNETK